MAAQRYSRQRELIYDTVCASHAHPTAEMVYSSLKPQNPTLSLGTVYRNLDLLVSQGRITRMSFPVERYDGDLHPHGHFVCDRCGGVSDVELPYDAALDAAARAMGNKVTGHTVTFRGLCPACAAQEADISSLPSQ